MISVRLIPLLVVVTSAQYAITDLISHEGGKPTASPQIQTGVMAQQMPSAAPQTGMPGIQQAGNQQPVNTATAGNAMASLLSAVTGANMAGQSAQTHQSASSQALSQDSMAVVSGLVEAFMHKVKLQAGERSCLESNVGQLTGDVMGTVGDIVTAVKALIAGKGTVSKSASGGLVQAGIDSAMKITSLAGLATQLVKNCVHGDALVLLNTTAQHMINGTYLEHRFLANGVDIAHSLSDSIVAFEAKDFHRFGTDIGIALRKILLSTNSNATTLPEGIPEEVIIQKATDGLMRGFFIPGAAVEITDTAYPDLDVNIDLHKCIAGNSGFFKEIWMSTWDLIAQLSVNAQQHNLGAMFQPNPQGGQPKWSGELMIAMMQFPMALTKCGLSPDMQTMFNEALQSLNDVNVQFKMPRDKFQAPDTAAKMAKAVEAWTNWDFERFGYELGELFRELLMLALPQKYSITASGRLQRYSQSQASVATSFTKMQASSVVIVGGAAVSVLVALTVVRTRRSKMFINREALPTSELEDGVTAALVE